MTDYTIEAEDMQLDGYTAQSNSSDASGGGYIQTWGDGVATSTFEGEAGTYHIDLTMFDENDGASTVELVVNGEVVSIVVLDQDEGGNYIHDTLTKFSLTEVELQPGDVIEIRGTCETGEAARIDKIDLTAVTAEEPVDPSTVGENVVILNETFDDQSNVAETEMWVGNGYGGTNASWDGDLNFQTVDVEGYTNGKISIDMAISQGAFEAWGTDYGDFISVELIDQDGTVHVLDVFTGWGSTLTGTHSGQTINGCNWTTLQWDIPEGVTSFTLSLQSDISADCEIICFDNLVITADELLEPEPIPVIDAVDDSITVQETEGAGDIETLDDGSISVLANDTADGATYTGDVVEVNGVSGSVGDWIDLDKGRVKINSDGTVDFDAAGDFDALNDDESETIEVTYAISTGESLPEEYQCLFFNEFEAGTVMGDQLISAGVTISSANASKPVMVFDTANVTGGDTDLATSNLGKVLIISEDGDSSDPDDNAGGGTFILDYERPADVSSLSFLDTEEPGAEIRFYNEAGDLITTIQGPVTPDGGQAVAYFDVTGVARMEVELQGSGAIDNLVYTLPAVDAGVVKDTATLSITVEGVSNNEAPVAVDDALSVFSDKATDAASDGDVLLNDSDPENDPISVVGVTGGEVGMSVDGSNGGSVVINADGSYEFSTDNDFDGLARGETATTTFEYAISDGKDASDAADGGVADDTAILTVTVTGVNRGPVANDDAVAINEDGTVTPALLNILTNDTDVENDVLTVTAIENGAVGVPFDIVTDGGVTVTVTVDANGGVSFDTAGQFDALNNGDSDFFTFTYTADDGFGGSDTAVATVTINGANLAPVAVADAISIQEDETIVADAGDDPNANTLNILANDSDPDGDQISLVSVAGAVAVAGVFAFQATTAGGVVVDATVDANGNLSFDTNGAFDGLGQDVQDSFSFAYVITDGNGEDATETVTVTINGENLPPVADPDSITIAEGETIVAPNDDPLSTTLNILDNDSDPDGDALVVSEAGGLAPGSTITVETALGNFVDVVVSASGDVTFDSAPLVDVLNAGDTDSFTIEYTAQDPNGETDTATLTINVTGEDSVAEGTSYNVVFLVDTSGSTAGASAAGEAILSDLEGVAGAIDHDGDGDLDLDLNGDGVFDSELDAELHIVNQINQKLGTLGADVDVAIYTYDTGLFTGAPGGDPAVRVTDGVNDTFQGGQDLSAAFLNADGNGGVGAFNLALQGAVEFFGEATMDDGAIAVNQVFMLTDGDGFDWTVEGDPASPAVVAELRNDYDAFIDVIGVDAGAAGNNTLQLIEQLDQVNTGDEQDIDIVTTGVELEDLLDNLNVGSDMIA